MTKEQGVSRYEIINELIKSRHGSYNDYIPKVMEIGKEDPEFLQKLIVWNLGHGEIRDSKVSLPIISLRTLKGDDRDLAESAIASLMTLDPKNLVKAYHFNSDLVKNGITIPHKRRKMFQEALQKYLQVRENVPARWNGAALQHRKSMKTLYAVSHTVPSDMVQNILFKRNPPAKSVFGVLKKLKDMTPKVAAGTIMNYNIPFQIALGALGAKRKEFVENPEFLLALMEGMSGQQAINNTKMLAHLGVMDNPILKSEYDKAIKRAKADKKVSTLKAGKAIQVLEETGMNKEAIQKLTALQEAKIEQHGIEGDWLVLGDCSGSMRVAIKLAVEIAGYLARSVKGKVHLIFFNVEPRYFDVTGKTLEAIKDETKRITALGGTSIGCGVKFLMDRKHIVNGIAIVSDGGDNTYPLFKDAYPEYCKKFGIEPPVYFFHVPGDHDVLSHSVSLEKYEMKDADYYSLPNIVSMMKTTRYSLVDEIMQTPLLTFAKVFGE